MAITISGTDGIVGAGFTVDNSGVSVTAGVGTFGSIGAGTSVAAAGLHGTMPTIDGSALTSINTPQLVGVCTSGFSKTGGFGKVLQYVTGTTTTQAYKSNDSSLGDTGLTATITPASGTKILVIINQPFYVGSHNHAGDSRGRIKVLRDSTSLSEQLLGHDSVSASWFEMWTNFTFNYLDTHGADGSTAVTYKTQYAGKSNVEAYVQRASEGYTQRSNITLLEVE